ncbi:MAG: transposase [Planctomycetes bacterium]|nr:transposase [Planctomycetota bacterium]
MVAGYHLIWTVYGYWLPNDPRGSTSKEVRVEPIAELGEVHYGRKAVQPSAKEIRVFHAKAHDVLKHPVLTFDDDDIALLGKAFGEVIVEKGYTCYACAIMPDHVHLLIRRHRDLAEDMIKLFQESGRRALIAAEKRSPVQPVWTDGPGWKTFINSRRQFEQEIEYIRGNLLKIGRPEQVWDFVKKYDGWMPACRG